MNLAGFYRKQLCYGGSYRRCVKRSTERRLREREILKLKPESKVCIKRDVHTLKVELPKGGDPAKRFAQAFGDMMAEDGAEFGLITLRRPKSETGKPFDVGHRFQGRYSLTEAAKEMYKDFCDGLFKGFFGRILRFFVIRKLLRYIEDEHLSDYGEIIAIDFPCRFQYQYLSGSPIAGSSEFLFEKIDERTCRVTQVFLYQELDPHFVGVMGSMGLKAHNQVVYEQVRMSAARIDAKIISSDIPPEYVDQLGKPGA